MNRLSDNFVGGNFVWFTGVVEDVNDPEMLGRVRARCFGFHDSNKGLVATESLPWSTVMGPTSSAHVSGIGSTVHGLVQGTWVVGFFRDGPSAQDPVIMGTIGSTYDKAPSSISGFSDPDEQYPTKQQGDEGYIDTNALSRGVNTVSRTVDTTINEPESAFAASYPHNKVTETTSGHLIEIDDTPGAERIRVRHTSGTFVEIHPNGDLVSSAANRYTVTQGNDSIHVKGTVNIFVDGTTNVNVDGTTNITCPTTNLTCQTTNIVGNVNITGNLAITGTSTALIDHISAGISGKGHTHTDTPGIGAGTTSPPK